MVADDPKVLKKIYCAPSFHILDLNAARTELGAKTKSSSKDASRMLSLMERKLGVNEIRRKFSAAPPESIPELDS
jgi:hypothetical protein